ncbi:hypothetical protein N9D51_01865 [Actinomycetota bacterium]|nr:hypothetical protein [Actinomycetota bacterium]
MGLFKNKFAAVAIALATSMTLVSCGASGGDNDDYEQDYYQQDDYDYSDDYEQDDYDTDCTPGYEPCLPPAADYDCEGGSGDGPAYTGRVYVTGGDPYGLDRDGNGLGCEWS